MTPFIYHLEWDFGVNKWKFSKAIIDLYAPKFKIVTLLAYSES